MTRMPPTAQDAWAFSPARPDPFAAFEAPRRQVRLLRVTAALLAAVALLTTLAATALSLRPLPIVVVSTVGPPGLPTLSRPTLDAPADADQAARFLEHLLHAAHPGLSTPLQQPPIAQNIGPAADETGADWAASFPVLEHPPEVRRWFLGAQGALTARCVADARPHVFLCLCDTLMVDVAEHLGTLQATAQATPLLALVVRAPRSPTNVWGLRLLDVSVYEDAAAPPPAAALP